MNDKSGIKDPAGRLFLFLSFANIRPLRKADKAVRSALTGGLVRLPASALAGRYRQEKERTEKVRPRIRVIFSLLCGQNKSNKDFSGHGLHVAKSPYFFVLMFNQNP